MKFYLRFFFLASLSTYGACGTPAYTDQEYFRVLNRSYSSEELSITGQEWLDFCREQKELFSRHDVKFTKITSHSELASDNASLSALTKVEIGGIKLNLPITAEMNLTKSALEIDDPFYEFVLRDDNEYISIKRSEIIELTSLFEDQDASVKLIKKIFPNKRAITDVSIILSQYSLTPSDVKCTSLNEDADKLALLLLGSKSLPLDLIELKSAIGYVLVQKELTQTGYVSMNLMFESGGSVYDITYMSKSKGKRENFFKKLISNITYVSDIHNYQIGFDKEFQFIREKFEGVVNSKQ